MIYTETELLYNVVCREELLGDVCRGRAVVRWGVCQEELLPAEGAVV
jgi:hypothetical protein